MDSIVILIVYAVCAIAWGFVAKEVVVQKGYKEQSGKWFTYGFLFGIFAVIVAFAKPYVVQQVVIMQKQETAADQIKHWKELLDSGVISQSEFEQKKRELL